MMGRNGKKELTSSIESYFSYVKLCIECSFTCFNYSNNNITTTAAT